MALESRKYDLSSDAMANVAVQLTVALIPKLIKVDKLSPDSAAELYRRVFLTLRNKEVKARRARVLKEAEFYDIKP